MWHWNTMGPWGWIIMIVFWVTVVAVVVWSIRTLGARPDPDDAKAILDKRFARGEIDQQEYEERRRILRGEG